MNSINGIKEAEQMNNTIPKEVRIAILKNEKQIHINTKWLYEQRYAVAKTLGKEQSALDAIEAEVLKEQMEISQYESLIAAIEAE